MRLILQIGVWMGSMVLCGLVSAQEPSVISQSELDIRGKVKSVSTSSLHSIDSKTIDDFIPPMEEETEIELIEVVKQDTIDKPQEPEPAKKQQKSPELYDIHEFDTRGNCVRYTYLNDGKPWIEVHRQFDQNSRLIRESYFQVRSGDFELIETWGFEHNGDTVHSTCIEPKRPDMRQTEIYHKGIQIKEIAVAGDHIDSSYHYRVKDNVQKGEILLESVNGDRTILYRNNLKVKDCNGGQRYQCVHYEYDRSGLLIRKTYSGGSLEKNVIFTYQYKKDSRQNWIKQICYVNSQFNYTITRKIAYY